jgi:hypothetical protein
LKRGKRIIRVAYLHDELNRTNEVSKELEKQIFLFFLHLIQAILLPPSVYFGFCETNAGVSLELVLRNDASSAWSRLLLILVIFSVAILGLELVNQSVFLLILRLVGNSRHGIVLLIEVARLDLGIEVIGIIKCFVRAGSTCRRHGCSWREAMPRAPSCE